MPETSGDVTIVRREYSHPDAVRLIAELQDLYTRIYGSPDASPIDDDEFVPPRGVLALGYLADEAVAMGAWRRVGNDRAELKRMYVADRHRGRGFSRAIVAWLETSARDHGVGTMVLETNKNHPAAIALYRSAGYSDIPHYGYYADNPDTVSLARKLRADPEDSPG
jgi:GNAT superfamily N-acetyltransferase